MNDNTISLSFYHYEPDHPYADHFYKNCQTSFYQKYLKISLANPYTHKFTEGLATENVQLSYFFFKMQNRGKLNIDKLSLEEQPAIELFKNEFRNKSLEERKALAINLAKMNAHFKLGNQISPLSWIALKIANFFLSLFGYAPYPTTRYKVFTEVDFDAFKNLSREARQLTPAERANAKWEIHFLNPSSRNFEVDQKFTDAIEQLKRGLRGKVIHPHDADFVFKRDANNEIIFEYNPVISNEQLQEGENTFHCQVEINLNGRETRFPAKTIIKTTTNKVANVVIGESHHDVVRLAGKATYIFQNSASVSRMKIYLK